MAAAPNKILGNKLQSVRALAIQTGILIHEVDEGSPCLKCGDKCKNGFSLHYWRKVCANCHCPREEHDVRPHHDEKHTTTNVGKILFHPTIINEAAKSPKRHRSPIAGAKQLESPSDTPSILRKTHNFTWTPKDCSVDAAKSYFEGLPINKKPISSTPGDRYWQKQKIRQLPAHDIDLIYCNELSDEECKQMELFVKIRREKFLGRANVTTKQSDSVHTICCECHVPFKVGEAFLTADKLPNKFWHPSCFMCSKCKELLIEMIYFVHEGKLYCGRDHAEQLKPRCAACDEIIFCSEYTRAEDQNWHVNHFCCHRCDNYLGGKNYMASKEGQPYCLSCYEIKFANICVACGSTIPLDEPLLKHNDSYWHAKPDCFKCYVCKKSLVDQPFLPKHNVVFCSKECFREFKKRGL